MGWPACPYAPTARAAVPSVLMPFTAWFGMEQRGSASPLHAPIPLRALCQPIFFVGHFIITSLACGLCCRRAATDTCLAISTSGLYRSRGLHPWPAIRSSPGCLPTLRCLRTHLVAGFPLRCCQRFSVPDVATQHCRSPHNWSTSGPSSPVLSY